MNIKLEISLDFDPDTKCVKILSCIPISSDEAAVEDMHIISPTQLRFGILTLGKKFGKVMPRGEKINLYLNQNFCCEISTHKNVGGRIDGLTKIYKDNPEELFENGQIKVIYNKYERSLYLYTK